MIGAEKFAEDGEAGIRAYVEKEEAEVYPQRDVFFPTFRHSRRVHSGPCRESQIS